MKVSKKQWFISFVLLLGISVFLCLFWLVPLYTDIATDFRVRATALIFMPTETVILSFPSHTRFWAISHHISCVISVLITLIHTIRMIVAFTKNRKETH